MTNWEADDDPRLDHLYKMRSELALDEFRRQKSHRTKVIVLRVLLGALVMGLAVVIALASIDSGPLSEPAADVCDLIGMTYEEATQYAAENALSIGVLQTYGEPVNLIYRGDDGSAVAAYSDGSIGYWPNRQCGS